MKYVKGILGGLLGGLIGALPWMLVYIYGNYLISLLAAIIAFGIAYGYKLFKGPINKKYPIIITVLSLLIVALTTLVFIPLWEVAQAGYDISFYNLKLLYQSSEFVSAVMRDLVVSIIFTVLGISGVIAKAKKQISSPEEKEVKEKAKTKEE